MENGSDSHLLSIFGDIIMDIRHANDFATDADMLQSVKQRCEEGIRLIVDRVEGSHP